jgi:hypothetical protein
MSHERFVGPNLPNSLIPLKGKLLVMNKVLVHGKHATEWVTISKDEYESLNRTIEVLTDNDLMTQIRKGKRKNIKSRDFEEVAKELGI